jgi:type I restriction enzyme S subunit
MIGRYGPPLFQILKGLEGSYNVALMKADPKPKITRVFLFHLLRSPKLQADVISQSERSAGQTGVNLKFLNVYPAYCPPEKLQVAFEKIVGRQEFIRERSKKATSLADEAFFSLQNRAFSGQL